MTRLVLLLVFLVNPLGAQTEKHIEVNSAVTFIDNTFRNIINPSYSVETKNHGFSVGPVIQLYTNTGQNNLAKPWLTGIRGAYQYIPHRNSKKVDFSFKLDLIYQHIIDKYHVNHFDVKQGVYRDFRYQNTEDVVEFFAGYGFKFNIQRFYVKQRVGAGLYLSRVEEDEISAGAPKIEEFDFRGYGNFGLAWNVLFGVGYRLK